MMNISPMVNSVKCTVLAYSGNPAMLFAYSMAAVVSCRCHTKFWHAQHVL